ncbi:prepilin peptidase [Dryocola clanedunensis]
MYYGAFFLLALIAVAIVVAYKDICERRIPNVCHYVILLLAYIQNTLSGNAPVSVRVFLVCFIILGVGILLSHFKIMGYGDTKLIFTASLVMPEENIIPMIYLVLFGGGVWAITWEYGLSRLAFIKKMDKVQKGIPYAIPILFSLCLLSFIGKL